MKSEFLCGCELRNAWKGLIFQTYFTSSSPLIFHIFHVSYFLDFIFLCGSEMCRQVISDISHLLLIFQTGIALLSYFHEFRLNGKQFKHSPGQSCQMCWDRKIANIARKNARNSHWMHICKSPSAEQHEENG